MGGLQGYCFTQVGRRSRVTCVTIWSTICAYAAFGSFAEMLGRRPALTAI